ncbi:MAG: tripartite tricarboxylate transporter substrate binding protein [Candidatus Rokubacteria bacterium]|nr:tripartite tricarboxylate transporter substrate binding protein [Candidatus Rokubacteria bacterium]
MRRIVALLVLVLLAGALPASSAETVADTRARLAALKPKDFPTQPLEFVVVYPAGGGMDTTARLLGKYVEKYTDHRVVVVNKTGGAGFIGHTYLATQAKPDGYTVGVLAGGVWSDAMQKAKDKWSHKNFEAVAFINYAPVTWIVSTEGRFKDKSLKDVAAAIKREPGTVKAAIVPSISFEFLAEQVETKAGGKVVKVPFQGGAPGVTALLGGHVDIATGFLSEYRGHLEADKVKVVATAAEQRTSDMPQVPTFNEVLGAKNMVWSAWRFAAVPRGVPADRKKYLEAVLAAALRDPELQAEYRKTGSIVDNPYANAAAVDAAIDKLAALEREFLAGTGRLAK